MADKKTAPAKTPEAQIAELEARIEKLEAAKCECPAHKLMAKVCKDGKCPTQDEARQWIKDNPFLALGIAVLVSAFVFGILF